VWEKTEQNVKYSDWPVMIETVMMKCVYAPYYVALSRLSIFLIYYNINGHHLLDLMSFKSSMTFFSSNA